MMLQMMKFDEIKLKAELKKARLFTEVEYLRKLYSVKTLPVRVEGIVINFSLYQSFLRKLKGFETKISISHNSLRLEYRKFGTPNKGVVIFEDLSNFFKGFMHIPVAVVDGD